MKNYDYQVTITAQSEQQADTKIGALGTLAQKLNERELAVLAEVVKNDPVKLSIAKKALGL